MSGVCWCCVTQELVKDTIYVLYEPPEGEALYDVVFLHGLQLGDYRDAWKTTWESTVQGAKVLWPAELLARDFPQARVLSISYDSSARQAHDRGNMKLRVIGEMLAQQLTTTAAGVGTRPVVLVGHSLGGLVLKQTCLALQGMANGRDADDRRSADAFLRNIKGMVFYATPHLGAHLADLAKALLGSIVSPGAVVTCITSLSDDAGEVNEHFDALRSQYGWSPLGFYEQNHTKVVVSS